MKTRSDLKDITGQFFGDLEVIEIDEEKTKQSIEKYNHRVIYWKCKCQKCGTVSSRRKTELNKIKNNNSSGCSRCRGIWLVGQKFNRLTVLEDLGIQTIRGRKTRWLKCICDCGNEVTVAQSDILQKHAQSCGCFRIDTITALDKKRAIRDGDSVDPDNMRLYSIWNGMKQRCYVKSYNRYDRYGGRGIKVCDEWMDYLVFKKWALSHGYQDNLSIDRINIDGNYEPSNCRWATNEEQMNNTSKNTYITYKDRTQTLTQWCRELGLNYPRVKNRLKIGFTVEQAFETPVRGLFRSHKSICKIDGCNNYVKGGGYCQKHYERFKKYGNPHIIKKKNGELVEVDD